LRMPITTGCGKSLKRNNSLGFNNNERNGILLNGALIDIYYT
jgi:hypothetical protein